MNLDIFAIAVGVAILAIQGARLILDTTNRSRLPRSFDIAVLGEPQVGKTTFITSLFYHIFHSNLSKDLIVRGEATIDKVNEDILLLNTGRPPSPTKSIDVFTYRAEYTIPKTALFNDVTYKIQIGDYPGEYSEELTEAAHSSIIGSKFFDWTYNADMIIYVVDAHKLAMDNEYCEHIVQFIRSTWQHINDRIRDRDSKKTPSARIIITKADILYKMAILEQYKDAADRSIVYLRESDNAKVDFGLKRRINKASDFLSLQTDDFLSIITSHYLQNSESTPINMHDIALSILPKRF
ncbi:MAG: hypothetical protein CMM84_09445 [Rhodothermaceae bacterium]|nr:hypothetical protein [Rhodothermaceae bacterium]MBC12206.1 hypothetical protein [Rhodothermaceae bacterium]|tara:strand:- start:149 stop:1033 length:885 start_codon:yes stop_codon:yes gene_type:complete